MTAAASTVWYSSGWVTTGSRGYIVIALPTALGRQQIAWNLHYIQVQHLKTILGSQAYRVNYNIEQQFVCHVVGAFLDTGGVQRGILAAVPTVPADLESIGSVQSHQVSNWRTEA